RTLPLSSIGSCRPPVIDDAVHPSDAAALGAAYRHGEQATSRSVASDKTGTWMATAEAGPAQFVTHLPTMTSRATIRRLSPDPRRSGAHQRPRAERDPRSPRRP